MISNYSDEAVSKVIEMLYNNHFPTPNPRPEAGARFFLRFLPAFAGKKRFFSYSRPILGGG